MDMTSQFIIMFLNDSTLSDLKGNIHDSVFWHHSALLDILSFLRVPFTRILLHCVTLRSSVL